MCACGCHLPATTLFLVNWFLFNGSLAFLAVTTLAGVEVQRWLLKGRGRQ